MQTLINIFWSAVVALLLLLGFAMFGAHVTEKFLREHAPVSRDVVARASAEVWNEIEVAEIQQREDNSWFAGVGAWIFGSEEPELVALPDVSESSIGRVEEEKARVYSDARHALYTRPMEQKDRIERLDLLTRAINLNR
jgi:hypothetical protein